MRSRVFTDAALARQAGRFVWLSLDTEKAVNAPLKKKLSVDALPTFVVLDSATETPVLRWVGGATLSQLEKILDESSAAVRKGGSGLAESLARADRDYAAGKHAEAVAAYRDLLAKAPKGWKSRARATESLLYALQRVDDKKACATTARDAFPALRKTPSAANVAASGLECALDLPADAPGRAELVAALAKDAEEVAADPKAPIADDDRAAVYDALMSEREAAKDEAGKKAVAARLAEFLERQAERAKNADERASLDSWRLGAYFALGAPEKAVTALQRSEKELPDDYNPPARLALAYKELKKWDEALAASDRALAKAYGPRKITYYRARADIHAAKGDKEAAKKTLEEAIAYTEALPEGQRSEATLASLRKKLDALK